MNIFSKHLHWLDWEEMAKTAAIMDFDGLDLTVRPGGHIEPENAEKDLPKLIELCSKEGLKVDMICTSINNVSEPTTEKIIKTASQLGVKYYRMDWHLYQLNKKLDDNLFYIKEKLTDLAELNEKYGIKGSYQNHDGIWFGSSVWDLGIILKEIDSEWLGCQYDVLNAVIEGINSWIYGLEFIAPYIHTICIKDAYWEGKSKRPRLKYSPLGEGMVDWDKFFCITNRLGLDVPLSLHIEHDLGGADTGKRKLTIPDDKVVEAINIDLHTLKQFIKKNSIAKA